ncbi:UNKNOWN [Stylonychia lemnae]|uniref:Uncharacterized protein n=1 Tax=Stylonychia lemnae TaxID=5949 RepID=A0A078A563_STYLE|nr:UNKNOWN [Stylonychia lemnae]|eukprot:CDW75884.1 UNKNOWN [Stylonychia lemnae]
MSNDQELLLLSTQIIETQNRISQSLCQYPRLNAEQISAKPIDVLSVLLQQIEFLFEAYQNSQSSNLDNDYTMMMNEKAVADCTLLRMSLQKSDEQIKALRIEKDYNMRQIDCLRKEVESLKNQLAQQAAQLVNMSSLSMFDQQQPLSYSSFGEQSKRQSAQSNNSMVLAPPSHNSSVHMIQPHIGIQNAKAMQIGVNHSDGLVNQLSKELKDLKFELQQREDQLNLKQDMIHELQTQLDHIRKNQGSEAERVRKENSLLNEQMILKEQQIQSLQQSCEQMMQAHSIEIPLYKQQQVNKLPKAEQKQFRSKSQHRSQFKNKLQFMKDIYEEAQMVLDEQNNDELLRTPLSLQNTVSKSKKKKSAIDGNSNTNQYNIENLVDFEELLTNQIQAARVAENTLNELQKEGDNKIASLDQVQTQYKELVAKQANMLQSKRELCETMAQIQSENDQVKAKFATLLDQFQEYVNLTEERQQEEETMYRQDQELLIGELTNNIRELEQLSQGMQQELQQKEELYNLLKNDFNRLEGKYQEQQQQQQNFDSIKEKQIQTLEEEVNYLKRHFDVEMGLLRDENEILKRELRDVNARRVLQQNQYILANNPTNRQAAESFSSPHRDIDGRNNNNNSNNLGIQQFNNQQCLSFDQTRSPFKSEAFTYNGQKHNNTFIQQNQTSQYIQMQEHPSMYKVQSANDLMQGDLNTSINHQQRVKDMIATTQTKFDKFKKDLIEKEKIIEEKNQEILRLRIALEDSVQQSKYNQIQNRNEVDVLRKNLIYDINIAISKLKHELSKSKALLSKDAVQIDKFDSNVPMQKQLCEDEFMNEVHEQVIELRSLVTLANEIALLISFENERNKSLINQSMASRRGVDITTIHQVQQPQQQQNENDLRKGLNVHDQNYQMKRTADNLLRNGQINQLYEHLLQQVSKSESLMQDNAILQRTLHKYETTLSELDSVLRETENGDIVLDLKRIAEKQLKEIVSLQREVEIVKFNDQPQFKYSQPEDQSKALTAQQYQQENEELLQERKTLLQLCEDLEQQVKDAHRGMEESLDKIMILEKEMEAKANEHEEIRQRITEVAELFEKKEIKQKYSFEVLCDFIFDKAKRLFTKYENAIKENKSEKSSHLQKRSEQLDQENDNLRQIIMQNQFIAKEVISGLSQLIGEEIPQIFDSQNDNYQHDIQFILNKLDKAFKDLHDENYQLKDRLQEILQQLDIYQNEVVNNKEMERMQLIQNEEFMRKEIDTLKREKERLVDRNSDLALALKDQTEDYKILREENERLRERLFMYERNQCNQSQILFTPVRPGNQVSQAKMLGDATNRISNPSSQVLTEKSSHKSRATVSNQEYNEPPSQSSEFRRENERFNDKLSKLQQKITQNTQHTNQQISLGGTSAKNKYCIASNDQFSKIVKDNKFESTSSYFTDEDEATSPKNHLSEGRNIQSEFY